MPGDGSNSDHEHKRSRGRGRVYKRANNAFHRIAYCHDGKEIRESARDAILAVAAKKRRALTEEEARAVAEKLLDNRLREVANDQEGLKSFVGPQQDRLTIANLLDAKESDFKLRGLKSLHQSIGHLNIVRKELGDLKATRVTAGTISRYIEQQLAAGRAAGTVNRRTALLRAAFRLAIRRGQLSSMPEFPRLREDNVRQGFFEKPQFEALLKALPEYLKAWVQFAYGSGWRKGEVNSLRWADVDMQAKVIRLRPEHSKNSQGRVLALEGELWNVIAQQWAMREYKKADKTIGISSFVFHREGAPIKSFRKSWDRACKAANVEGKHVHDLRRSAIRVMVRAGVPERVAMAISGHKTRAIFDRYNIVSEEDLRNAVVKTQAYLSTLPKEDNITVMPQRKPEAETANP